MKRTEVEDRWLDLIDDRESAEDVHRRAERWVRGEVDEPSEPLVLSGLQDLHGATGRASTSSRDESRLRLEEWRAVCAAYDADPPGWRRRRFRNTLRGLSVDHPDKAAAWATRFVREGWLNQDDIDEILGTDRPR